MDDGQASIFGPYESERPCVCVQQLSRRHVTSVEAISWVREWCSSSKLRATIQQIIVDKLVDKLHQDWRFLPISPLQKLLHPIANTRQICADNFAPSIFRATMSAADLRKADSTIWPQREAHLTPERSQVQYTLLFSCDRFFKFSCLVTGWEGHAARQDAFGDLCTRIQRKITRTSEEQSRSMPLKK